MTGKSIFFKIFTLTLFCLISCKSASESAQAFKELVGVESKESEKKIETISEASKSLTQTPEKSHKPEAEAPGGESPDSSESMDG